MRFLVDTNVISELRRRDRAHPSVKAWFQTHPVDDLFLSVISLMELENGILRLPSNDRQHRQQLRSWLDGQIRPQFSERLLPIDEAVALKCATFNLAERTSLADFLIAATALVHDLVVVTRNVRHFEPTGVRIFDPWTYSP
jgi:predicted nucleic acid-binding protein